MKSVIYLIVIIAIVSMGLYFKMYPVFPMMEKTTIRYNTTENFSSPAVSPSEPSCVKRNVDAQILLRMFPICDSQYKSPSEDALDRIELKLILNKLTCLDADVSNSGVAGYNTLHLPYNTSHDTEPLTNFVGRCLNNGARMRDIDLIIDKYEKRGLELILLIATRMDTEPRAAYSHYRAVIVTTLKALKANCLMPHSQLDRPPGPRDPGYSTPFSVEVLAPFKINGDL